MTTIFSEAAEINLINNISALIEKRSAEIAQEKMKRYMSRTQVSDYTKLKGKAFNELIIYGLKPIKYLATGKVYDRLDVDKAMERMKQR